MNTSLNLSFKQCFAKVLDNVDESHWSTINDLQPKLNKAKQDSNGGEVELPEREVLEYYKGLCALSTTLAKLEKNDNPRTKQIVAIEEAKLAVMKVILARHQRMKMLKEADLNYKKPRSSMIKAAFGTVVGLGTIMAVCEGIDGISSMLAMFNIAHNVIMIPAIAFSILSAFIYFGFDLHEISQDLGISFMEVKSRLMPVIEQQQLLTKAYKYLHQQFDELCKEENPDSGRLQELSEQFDELRKMKADVDAQVKQLTNRSSKQSKRRVAAKASLTASAGLLYGASGFFFGKGAALFFLNVAVAVTVPQVALVIALGVICASLALVSFWYLERKGVFRLVNKLAGMPSDPLNALKKDNKKLQKADDNIDVRKESVERKLQSQTLEQALTKEQNERMDISSKLIAEQNARNEMASQLQQEKKNSDLLRGQLITRLIKNDEKICEYYGLNEPMMQHYVRQRQALIDLPTDRGAIAFDQLQKDMINAKKAERDQGQNRRTTHSGFLGFFNRRLTDKPSSGEAAKEESTWRRSGLIKSQTDG